MAKGRIALLGCVFCVESTLNKSILQNTNAFKFAKRWREKKKQLTKKNPFKKKTLFQLKIVSVLFNSLCSYLM